MFITHVLITQHGSHGHIPVSVVFIMLNKL